MSLWNGEFLGFIIGGSKHHLLGSEGCYVEHQLRQILCWIFRRNTNLKISETDKSLLIGAKISDLISSEHSNITKLISEYNLYQSWGIVPSCWSNIWKKKLQKFNMFGEKNAASSLSVLKGTKLLGSSLTPIAAFWLPTAYVLSASKSTPDGLIHSRMFLWMQSCFRYCADCFITSM